jgi:II/X family phage/plasmid replication protein
MTDSIKSILDLSRLPKAQLEHIPVERTVRLKPKAPGPLIPFAAWMTIPSPLTRNGMRVKVITDEELTPKALVADFNIPNATVGQNAELGHSCYAANTIALDILKIFLAQYRVPRDSLDLLSVEDMQIGRVTITYLIPVPEGRHAQAIINAIGHRFQQFFPTAKAKTGTRARAKDTRYGGSIVGSKDSLTAYLHQRGWEIRTYSSPPNTIEGDLNDSVHQERVAFARNMVRIELTLTAEELRKYGLQPAAAWRTAHAEGVYQRLFDDYVRNRALRLHERLRTDRPKHTDIMKLSENIRHIVQGYLGGKALAECKLLKRPSKLASQKAKSAAIRAVLKFLRIDMNIPWVEHAKLGNTWMENVIVYAGDHHPPVERVPTSFCQANLPSIQEQLKIALDRLFVLRNVRSKVDPETGEVMPD